MISGVCGGLGHYLGVDPTIVRLAFVFLAFYHFLGVWVYLVLAVILPLPPVGWDESSQPVISGDRSQTTKVIGGGLVVLGLLAFASLFDFKLFEWMRIDNLWPALIVLLGVLLLVRALNSEE
jgi:phage shock protein C